MAIQPPQRFELDDLAHVEREARTIYAPGATPGDVLVVQSDHSLVAAPGGGSQPDGKVLTAGPLSLLAASGAAANPNFVAFRPGTHEAWAVTRARAFVLGADLSLTAAVDGTWDSPSIAFTPDGLKAYITDFDGNKVWIVDVAARTVTGSINVGDNPLCVAVAPDGSKAYVANWNAGTVTPINVATDTAGSAIDVGAGAIGGGGSGPAAIAFTPDGAKAYVAGEVTSQVIPITVATDAPGTPITIPSGIAGQQFAQTLAVSADGATLYVVTQTTAITPIATADDSVGTDIPVPGYAVAVAVAPDGTVYVVLNDAAGAGGVNYGVLLLDPGSGAVTEQVGIGGTVTQPTAIGISDDGSRAYVANGGDSWTAEGGSLSILRRVLFDWLA